jgi:hypothetical protein
MRCRKLLKSLSGLARIDQMQRFNFERLLAAVGPLKPLLSRGTCTNNTRLDHPIDFR